MSYNRSPLLGKADAALSNTYRIPTYSMGAGGVTSGSGTALSSTVFPCGHIVGYTGVPPKFCTSCGAGHQNMALHDANYYSNISAIPGSYTASGSANPVDWAVTAAGLAQKVKAEESKTPMKDWLDVQVGNVRKLAFNG